MTHDHIGVCACCAPEPTEQDHARWERWRQLRARKERATTDDERARLAREEEWLRGESMKEMMTAELEAEQKWFWLSFADERGFLGVTIVEAGGIIEATVRARMHDANPGGEVQAVILDPDNLPDESLRNRLLSEEELRANGLIG